MDQSRPKVRPGVLLVLVVVVALAVFDKAGLGSLLLVAPVAVKRVILLVATIAAGLGWFFVYKERGSGRPTRIWIALAGAVALTLSIPEYILYTEVPFKFILPSRLLYANAVFLARWSILLVGLGWIGPFFGYGRSRIAFVIGGTLLVLLWTAT